MKLPPCARPSLSFRPQVEQSESRFLLSAGLLAHADASSSLATAAVIKDRYAYHLAGFVKDTTPIYSLYLTNDTGDNLTLSLTTTDEQKTVRNFKGDENFASNEDILMCTDQANDWKFNIQLRVPGKGITGSFAFKPKNGMRTTMKAGFIFPPASGWFDADSDLSMQYKVQIVGTGAEKKLALMPAL
jgi:hypothetical protein